MNLSEIPRSRSRSSLSPSFRRAEGKDGKKARVRVKIQGRRAEAQGGTGYRDWGHAEAQVEAYDEKGN